MLDGVQREPPEHVGSRIAESARGPTVSYFVQRNGEYARNDRNREDAKELGRVEHRGIIRASDSA